VLALLLALQQVLRGGFQIIILTVELAHSHVHICRSAHCRVAVLSRKPQGDLVGAHCITEATLRNLNISQSKRAPDCVGDIPSHPQMGHSVGIRPVCCLEIPVRPGRESQERRCRPAQDMVVLSCEIEHPLGVFHGPWHIAPNQGNSGTVHGDRTGQTPRLLFVPDDHLGRWAFRSLTHVHPTCGVP
jgi:hypothetical protein